MLILRSNSLSLYHHSSQPSQQLGCRSLSRCTCHPASKYAAAAPLRWTGAVYARQLHGRPPGTACVAWRPASGVSVPSARSPARRRSWCRWGSRCPGSTACCPCTAAASSASCCPAPPEALSSINRHPLRITSYTCDLCESASTQNWCESILFSVSIFACGIHRARKRARYHMSNVTFTNANLGAPCNIRLLQSCSAELPPYTLRLSA